MTKSNNSGSVQSHLFKPLLVDIVSRRHAMVKLADAIDWQSFEDGLQECFCADNGRSSCSVRLMVALHYLKYASGMSDEAVLDEWLENPYWQYFTDGIMEIAWNFDSVHLAMNGSSSVVTEKLQPPRPGGCLESFLNDLHDQPDALSTEQIIEASRKTLQIQKIADSVPEA